MWEWASNLLLLNLNLTYEALSSGLVSSLLIFMLGKFNLFHFFDEIILVLLVWKIICIFLVKSCFLIYFICFPFQNWMVILTLLLLPKVSLRNLDFYLFYEVFSQGCASSPEIYQPAFQPSYCCHIWAVDPNHYLDMLDKL